MKSFLKGLAAGAVLAGVAAAVVGTTDKNRKKKALAKAAADIKDKIAKRASRIGKLTKAAYWSIVDATLQEYRGMKTLSETELKEFAEELKESWNDVRAILKKRKR